MGKLGTDVISLLGRISAMQKQADMDMEQMAAEPEVEHAEGNDECGDARSKTASMNNLNSMTDDAVCQSFSDYGDGRGKVAMDCSGVQSPSSTGAKTGSSTGAKTGCSTGAKQVKPRNKLRYASISKIGRDAAFWCAECKCPRSKCGCGHEKTAGNPYLPNGSGMQANPAQASPSMHPPGGGIGPHPGTNPQAAQLKLPQPAAPVAPSPTSPPPARPPVQQPTGTGQPPPSPSGGSPAEQYDTTQMTPNAQQYFGRMTPQQKSVAWAKAQRDKSNSGIWARPQSQASTAGAMPLPQDINQTPSLTPAPTRTPGSIADLGLQAGRSGQTPAGKTAQGQPQAGPPPMSLDRQAAQLGPQITGSGAGVPPLKPQLPPPQPAGQTQPLTWNNVDPAARARYEENVRSGRTHQTQEEALQYWQEKYQNDPQRQAAKRPVWAESALPSYLKGSAAGGYQIGDASAAAPGGPAATGGGALSLSGTHGDDSAAGRASDAAHAQEAMARANRDVGDAWTQTKGTVQAFPGAVKQEAKDVKNEVQRQLPQTQHRLAGDYDPNERQKLDEVSPVLGGAYAASQYDPTKLLSDKYNLSNIALDRAKRYFTRNVRPAGADHDASELSPNPLTPEGRSNLYHGVTDTPRPIQQWADKDLTPDQTQARVDETRYSAGLPVDKDHTPVFAQPHMQHWDDSQIHMRGEKPGEYQTTQFLRPSVSSATGGEVTAPVGKQNKGLLPDTISYPGDPTKGGLRPAASAKDESSYFQGALGGGVHVMLKEQGGLQGRSTADARYLYNTRVAPRDEDDRYGGKNRALRNLASDVVFDKPLVINQPMEMTPAAPAANNPHRVMNVSYPSMQKGGSDTMGIAELGKLAGFAMYGGLARLIRQKRQGVNPMPVDIPAKTAADLGRLCAIKTAAAPPSIPARLVNHLVPVGPRRDPMSADEDQEVEEGQSQWMPKLMQTDSTSIPEMMASPAKQGLLAGGAGAVAGGLGAAGLGYAASKLAPQFAGADPGKAALLSGLVGAGVGGIGAGLSRYKTQHKDNEHKEEVMRRLPAGATKHDYVNTEMLWEALMNRFGGANVR
jgi:hypothetical protein